MQYSPAWRINYIYYKVWDKIIYIHSQTWTMQPLKYDMGMDKLSHPTLYSAYDYSSMLGLKLIYISKRTAKIVNESEI